MRWLLGWFLVIAFALFMAQPAEAAIFGRNRSNVQVNVAGSSAVQVNTANRSFSRNRSSNVQVNVGGVVRPAAVPIHGASFGRINAFGSRAVVDRFGNVFEVNSFGQPLIRTSGFRGFNTFNTINTFGAFASPHCGF